MKFFLNTNLYILPNDITIDDESSYCQNLSKHYYCQVFCLKLGWSSIYNLILRIIMVPNFRHEKTRGHADTVRGNILSLRKFSASLTAFSAELTTFQQSIRKIFYLSDHIGMFKPSAYFISVSTYLTQRINSLYMSPLPSTCQKLR